MDVDVLVLGAGPAGAVAALTLARRGRRVMLIDSGSKAHRALGDVMPPGAWPHLAKLGAQSVFNVHRHLRSWQQSSSWGSARLATRDLSFHPHGCAWHLDREVFDADLLAAARDAGAICVLGERFRGAIATRSGWEIELQISGHLAARFVVDASGRSSAFARQIGVDRKRRDRLVAMMASIGPAELAHAGYVALLVEACENGWWYLSPMPDGRAIASFMTDADLLPSGRAAQQAFWWAQLRQTIHIQIMLSLDQGVLPKVKSAPAGMERLTAVHGKGWLAVGDAAVAFDPLSSLGLVHALETGRLGGLAADAALDGEFQPVAAYERVVKLRADECDIARRGFYDIEQRWPESLFWVRRSGRAPGAKTRPRSVTTVA